MLTVSVYSIWEELTLAVRALAGMVRELELEVLLLLLVPDQLAICQPVEGEAPLRLIEAPAVYWPVGQPVELDGDAVGLLPCPVCSSVRA